MSSNKSKSSLGGKGTCTLPETTTCRQKENETIEEKPLGDNAKSLCALCIFDVLLVFSWEADNQSLTTFLYDRRLGGEMQMSVSVGGGGFCEKQSGIAKTERTLEHKNKKIPNAYKSFANSIFLFSYLLFV